MLEDVRHGIRNSGHSYAAIARATKGKVSERTIYTLFEDTANPTIGTLGAVAEVLAEIKDKQLKDCDGCRHNEESLGDESDGIICRIHGAHHRFGCCMRRN